MSPLTIAVSGASGLIGSALTRSLVSAGHTVRPLVRREPANAREIRWTPSAHLLDERQLSNVDVIVNLAGEAIGHRWTPSRRRRIRDSRVSGTDTLVAAIERAGRPITLINGSAVGFYGSRGDELLTEPSTPGRGYLAQVCEQWEQAAMRARVAGSRVVMLRTGVVLSNDGGALPEMLRPFRLGVGGKIASGNQWLAWISIADAVRAIAFLLEHAEIRGPVNVVSPAPVTNAEFTDVVARVLKKPALVPVPALALKLLFGEMAEETLLASQRAIPGVLSKAGFAFEQPGLESAIPSS